MAAEGFQSLFPVDAFAVMGFTDVARALPLGLKRAGELADHAVATGADAAIFIDGWAFSRVSAKRFRRRGAPAKLFKFAAPQVWASRPQRVDFVKAYFDGVLCLLPFEPKWFEKVGVRAAFVGNPNFQAAWGARGDGARFRAQHGLARQPVLAVLPGSRASEIRHLMEPFGGAVGHIAERLKDLTVVVAAPRGVEALVREQAQTWSASVQFVSQDEKADAIAAADAALVKSGTISTEVAINRTPFIVAYKVDRLTAFWAKRVMTAPFATILNVVAGRELIPEFLQDECTPENLAADLLALMTDEEARLEQLEAFPGLLARLGVDGPPAAEKAAETFFDWMEWAPGAQ